MNVFFIKATYQNNVYQLSDFFTGTQYKQDALKKLDLVIKCDDGITSIIVPTKLPDLTDVKDYTHVIIPEQEKIYKIIATDYYNTSQYELTLDDDPFIANYQELKTKNLIINRTNDFTHFKGIHDINDMTTKRTINYVRGGSVNPSSKYGAWALLFFEATPTLSVKFKFNSNPSIFSEKNSNAYATMVELLAEYPEVYTNHPNTYDYFMKEVKVGLDSYQCQWQNVDGPGRLVWVKYTDYATEITVDKSGSTNYFKANSSDLNLFCFAIPFLVNTGTSSFKHLIGFDQEEFLYDIKIVDDSFFNFGTVTQTYDSSTREGSLSFSGLLNFSGVYDIVYLKSILDVSRPLTTSVFDYKPFKTHYLSVYGTLFEISPNYFDKLKIMMSISSGQINYSIYYDEKDNVIANGSFSNQTKWAVDQLEKFYQQNPTYKDQFYLKMMTDIGMKTVGGAIGGSVIPGVGTLVGGAVGLGAGLLDAGLSQINLNYQEKGLSLQPDQVMGNNSDLPLQLINRFGIFWIEKTVASGLDEMKTEYALRGFPTSIVAKIDNLTLRPNDIFSTAKLVHGELKETVKNGYVSGFINSKLKEGVIII